MTKTARATCASVAVTASLAVAWGVCQIGGVPRGQESSAAPRELSAQAVREADSLDLLATDAAVRPAALIEAAQPPRPTVIKPADSDGPDRLRVGQASQPQPNAKITLGTPSNEPISGGSRFVIRGITAAPKASTLKAPGRGIVKRKTNFATPGIAAAPLPGTAADGARSGEEASKDAPQVAARPSDSAQVKVAAKPDVKTDTKITAKPAAEPTDKVVEQSPSPSQDQPTSPAKSRLKVAKKSPARSAPQSAEAAPQSQSASVPRTEASAKIAAAPPAESRLKISASPPVKIESSKPALKMPAPTSPPLMAAKAPAPATVRTAPEVEEAVPAAPQVDEVAKAKPAPEDRKQEPGPTSVAEVVTEKKSPPIEAVVEAEPVPAELAAPRASQSAAVPAHTPKVAAPAVKQDVAQVEPSAPTVNPEMVVPQPAIKSEPVVAAPAIQAVPPGVEHDAQRELAKVESPAAPEVMPEDPPADVADTESPVQTRLPLARAAAKSPELVAAVRRADERVRHGFDLAARGATYAGKTEFLAAVKLIAQAYDAHEGTRQYSKAAAAGIAALRESADFVRQSQRLAEADVAKIILHHTTPVLKDKDTSDLPANAAAHAYYTYAQEQLAAAVAGEPCGSMALFGMGKVAMYSSKTTNASLEQTGQAIALFRAALIAGPQNYQAANELGVMLAENGQLELARDLLIRSVAVSPQVTTWKNLAVVHKRAGDGDLAKRAESQALALQKTRPAPSDVPNVQWVDPATFSSTTSSTDSIPVANAPKKQSPAPAKPSAEVARTPNEAPKKGIGEILGLSPRRQ